MNENSLKTFLPINNHSALICQIFQKYNNILFENGICRLICNILIYGTVIHSHLTLFLLENKRLYRKKQSLSLTKVHPHK